MSKRQLPPLDFRRALVLVLAISVIGYAVAICVWFVLRLGYGDTFSWLALANAVALYLFVPLLLLFPLVLVTRKFRLLLFLLVPLALVIFLFGSHFLPSTAQSLPDQPSLRVMTFNVFGNSDQPELATTLIESENPDVVLIQELSPRHSYDITGRLGERYPYRQFEPLYGRRGIGILSRVPIERGDWIQLGRDPYAGLAVTLDWQGEKINLINVHLESTMPGENVDVSFRERETQVRQLLELVAAKPGPTIVGGDFNMTDTTQGYTTLAAGLNDTYRHAGWGLGTTFPTNPIFLRSVVASALARVLQARSTLVYHWLEPIYIPPQPLLRIDYILTTPELVASEAFVAPWDGQSDHRAVIAELQFATP